MRSTPTTAAAELPGAGRARRLAAALLTAAAGARRADPATSVDGNLVLSGVVSDAGKADKVQRLAASIAGRSRLRSSTGWRSPAEPGQSAGAHRRGERYDIERDRLQLAEVGSTIKFTTTNLLTIAAETTDTFIAGHPQRPPTRTVRDRHGMLRIYQRDDLRAGAGGVHHEPSRAEPDSDVRSNRQLSRGRRVPGAYLRLLRRHNGSPTITVEFKNFGVALTSRRPSSTPIISTCGFGLRSASCRPSVRCRCR